MSTRIDTDNNLDFYPRSPCGERRVHYDNYHLHCVISIHALLAESDCSGSQQPAGTTNFYPRSPCGERLEKVPADVYYQAFLSTLSLRRATKHSKFCRKSLTISIHALLAESDQSSAKSTPDEAYFYPRSPCGERQMELNRTTSRITFLSTLSLRRATSQHIGIRVNKTQFLSTLSLRRATVFLWWGVRKAVDFYPRSPCGERLRQRLIKLWKLRFLSTLSLRRATYHQILLPRSANYFYPRSPCGERLTLICDVIAVMTISIHALLAESD